MFTKIILFAVLAACGVHSKQATSPDVQLGGDPAENAKAAAAAKEAFERRMQLQREMQAASSRATSPDEPTDKQPGEPPVEEGQHFCCQQVDLKDKSGEGCITVGPAQIDTCSELLYCGGDYGKSGGKTKCLD